MKFLSLLTATFFAFTTMHAQSNFTITGNVINEIAGTPMQGASVFAENTTLGTTTDSEGNFKLVLPNGGYDLVISFTGFKTESKRITTADAGEKLSIKLNEKQKELETVSIVASNEVKDGLAKYGSFFMDEFIGKTANSKLCSIQNPEVLKFFFSKKKNRLKILAKEPLIIKNEALGYNIKYALDSFTHEYNTQVSIYTGNPLYENMAGDSAQNIKWQLARREAYKGSVLHFMRSVFAKNLKEQQFEIQFVVKVYGKDEAVKVKDTYAAIN
jgi:CarboxypepD_reg-like domain